MPSPPPSTSSAGTAGAPDAETDPRQVKALSLISVFVGIALIGSVVIHGANVIIPISVAVLLWHLINAIARVYNRVSIAGVAPPMLLCRFASIATIFLLSWVTVDIIVDNVAQVRSAAPSYEQNLRSLIQQLSGLIGPERIPPLDEMLQGINLGSLITSLSTTLGAFAGNASLVALYVVFLLLEQGSFDQKLKALFKDPIQRRRAEHVLDEIERRIERYLWIKTVLSLLTAILCYLVLIVFDVDYAGFWALVVFLFNYIPNIGSLFAVLLPSLLTLLQFANVAIFVFVLAALSGIQFVIGSFVEPRMMGSTLNLSPFVIILSLTFWGSIWGIAGMFLCVPIMVIIAIVLSQFEPTRPIAVLLSADGRVEP